LLQTFSGLHLALTSPINRCNTVGRNIAKHTSMVAKLIDSYIKPHPRATANLGVKAAAEKFGFSNISRVNDCKITLGGMTHFVTRYYIASILTDFLYKAQTDKDFQILNTIIILGSDSTPLPLSAAEKAHTRTAAGANHGTHTHKAKGVTSKIQQCELTLAITVQSDIAKNNFTAYIFEIPCPLQLLGKGTALTILLSWLLQLDLPILDVLRRMAKANFDIALADRDAANILGHEMYMSLRALSLHWRLPCAVHMLHTVCGKVLHINQPIISGLIAHGLSQKACLSSIRMIDASGPIISNYTNR
jgi:hypothetical protein